ncbi:MAG TPA: DedA family protein [Streptosporangiaceae bacterium]|nr:DedA family protein [Streptosporangiaceae bacterium]
MENFLTQVMTSHGYLALIIFAFIEACCIPISSEITFAFAGVIAAQPHSTFTVAAVIIIGTLAEMGGSLTSYAIGRRGGRHLLERYGRWVLISHADLDRAERFFAGRGAWAVAVARVLPIVRCFASFGAGVVEIPVLPFTIFSLIGTVVWTTTLTLLGYNLGSTVHHFFKSFSVVGIILVVLLLAALIAHRVHALRKDAHRRAAAETAAATGLPADVDPSGQPRVGTGNGTRSGRVGGAHRSGRPPAP